MRTIAILNQKGGVGKTTTVANLAAGLADGGHDVSLIDLDPQAHLTLHFGVEPGAQPSGIYEVLVDKAAFDESLVDVGERLHLCPSIIDLAAAEVELVTAVGREQILRDAVQTATPRSEFLLIDCPPSLGLLTLNALAAADEVYIPLQPHFLALQGLGKLLETVNLVRSRLNPNLRVTGVILCMFETNTRLAGEVVDDLRSFLDASRGQDVPWSGARVLRTVIRRNVKLAECPSHGQTIFDYEPNCNGAIDYAALTEEFLEIELGVEEHAEAPEPEPAQAQPPSTEPVPPEASELTPEGKTEPQTPVAGEEGEAEPIPAPAARRVTDPHTEPVPEHNEAPMPADQPVEAPPPEAPAPQEPPSAGPADETQRPQAASDRVRDETTDEESETPGPEEPDEGHQGQGEYASQPETASPEAVDASACSGDGEERPA